MPSSITTRRQAAYSGTVSPIALTNNSTTRAPISSAASSSTSNQDRPHVCEICSKAFTTTGHLTRHVKTHSGEKNHKCPFPGCNTRCSRHDNLQQHYRTHLSPGSRRSKSSGSRRVLSRATSASTSDLIAASNNSLVKSENSRCHSLSLPRLPTPPLEPPALEQAWIVSHTRPFSPAPPVHEQGSLEDPVQPRDKRRIHSHSPALSSHASSLPLPGYDICDRSLTPSSSTSSSYSSPMPEDTYPALARPVFGPGADATFGPGAAHAQVHLASSTFSSSRDNTQWLSKREIRHPQPAYHIPTGHMSHPFQNTSSRANSNSLMPVGLAAATREEAPRLLHLDVEDEGGVIPNIAGSASASMYDAYEYGKPSLSVPMRRSAYSATYSPSSGGISPVSPSSYPSSLGTSPTSSWSLASDTSRPPSCVAAPGATMGYTSELAQSGCIPQQQQAVFSHVDAMTVPSQPATPPMLYPPSTYVTVSDNDSYTTGSMTYPMVPSNGQDMYQDHMTIPIQQQQQPTLFDQFCKSHPLVDSHGAMRYDAPTLAS